MSGSVEDALEVPRAIDAIEVHQRQQSRQFHNVGAALQRDVSHADCQLVLADSASAAALGAVEHIDVDSAQWEKEGDYFLERGHWRQAAECFRRTLAVHPHLESARTNPGRRWMGA